MGTRCSILTMDQLCTRCARLSLISPRRTSSLASTSITRRFSSGRMLCAEDNSKPPPNRTPSSGPRIIREFVNPSAKTPAKVPALHASSAKQDHPSSAAHSSAEMVQAHLVSRVRLPAKTKDLPLRQAPYFDAPELLAPAHQPNDLSVFNLGPLERRVPRAPKSINASDAATNALLEKPPKKTKT